MFGSSSVEGTVGRLSLDSELDFRFPAGPDVRAILATSIAGMIGWVVLAPAFFDYTDYKVGLLYFRTRLSRSEWLRPRFEPCDIVP